MSIRFEYGKGFKQSQPFEKAQYTDRDVIANGLLHSLEFLIAQNAKALDELVVPDLKMSLKEIPVESTELTEYGYGPEQIKLITTAYNARKGFADTRYSNTLVESPDKTISQLVYFNPGAKVETNMLAIKSFNVTDEPKIQIDTGNMSRYEDLGAFTLPLIHILSAPISIPVWGNPNNPPLSGEIVESVGHQIVQSRRGQNPMFVYVAKIALELDRKSNEIVNEKIQKINFRDNPLNKPIYTIQGRESHSKSYKGPDGWTPDDF